MERSDTMSIFPSIFEELENSSFGERFDSQDFRDILSTTTNARSELKEEKHNPSYELWNNLDSDADLLAEEIAIPMGNVSYLSNNAAESSKVMHYNNAIYIIDDSSTSEVSKQSVMVIDADTPSTDDSNSVVGVSVPSLSLQPWKGMYEFAVSVQTSSYANSKWAYSTLLKKLFLRPFDSVPIEIKVSSWIDGYINITPVYVSSQYKSMPVNRCHNHKINDQDRQVLHPEHIVKVDNEDARYREDGSRYSVDIPLGCPAPGESGKLVYVKCGCWNTCIGGPNRQPFCLVFTLFNKSGEEIGRQILHLKVCACPVRDCGYSEKKYKPKESPVKGNGKIKMHKKKMMTPSGKVVKRIKSEPAEQNYEQILVPSDIAGEVKRFINRLMAEKYAKENNIQLPFPEY